MVKALKRIGGAILRDLVSTNTFFAIGLAMIGIFTGVVSFALLLGATPFLDWSLASVIGALVALTVLWGLRFTYESKVTR